MGLGLRVKGFRVSGLRVSGFRFGDGGRSSSRIMVPVSTKIPHLINM